ncbi:type II secretion system protein [Thalassotalea euphylliae]|uniref:Type II secretion system protein n=1 Tax=Thalassotalea euphylliae TaxID=1655234 RepID=A0A3E0TX34_9GAMM|nr:type II secretion system protein [Thalassotalea euphylliae]
MIDANKQSGFTLLELIVTIIIIGVLAVTALPRFTGTDGFEEYSYRTQAISILRNAQLRAMNQATNTCNTILIDNKNLGIPDNGSCNGFSSNFGDRDNDFTRVTELKITSDNIQFSTVAPNNRITFDKQGVPSCGSNCTIEIRGTETLRIAIEPQGYIHAQ